MLHALASFFTALALLFGGGAAHTPTTEPTLGSFTPVGGSTYYLSGAGITSAATTIQLTAFKTPDGRALTMAMFGAIGYGVLEPGTSKIEDVTFSGITANSDGSQTLTGVTRGNDFVSPYAASTTLAKAHSGGSTFIVSNTAGFYGQQFILANNNSTSTAIVAYSSTTPPRYDSPGVQANGSAIATTSEFASIAYVNAVAVAGGPNASTAVKGLIQIATPLQTASSTATGSTGAKLDIAASTATDTPQFCTLASPCLPVTDPSGTLSASFVKTSFAYVWTALHTFSSGILGTASSTFSSRLNVAASNTTTSAANFNGVAYAFPSSQGSNTFSLQNDGSGNLSWASSTPGVWATTTSAIYTGGTAQTFFSTTIPANVLAPGYGITSRFFVTFESKTTTAKDFKVAYGGSTCVTTAAATPGATTDVVFSGYLEFTIFATSTSAENCTAAFIGGLTQANVSGSSGMMVTAGNGTAAVANTSNQTLSVSSDSGATDIITVYPGMINRLR